jgi:hypothetical protein
LIGLIGISAGPSSAEDNPNGPEPVQLHGATVTITLSSTTNTVFNKDGGGGNAGGGFTIPPCFYEPVGDTSAFLKQLDDLKRGTHGAEGNDPTTWPGFQTWINRWYGEMGKHETEIPQGTWYQATCADYSSLAAAGWLASNHPDYVYVGPKDPAPPGIVIISPLNLAQYALASVTLPPPTPTFSPAATGPSFVNLTTWAWQQVRKEFPLNLTASDGAQSATVFMTPTAMTLTTDGPTASGIPAVCTDTNGFIGVPYAPGDTDPVPPGCGLKFTAPGNYVIHTRGTWKITWTSPQVQGVQTFPDVQLTTDTAVTVKEIQSIN